MRAFLLTLAGLVLAMNSSAQMDDVEIRVTELGGSVYMLEGRGGNIGASIGPDGIFLIDDQFAPLTPKITAALRALSDGPIRFVINTHYHGDHVGGNEQLGKGGSVIVSHDNIRALMSSEQVNQFLGRTTPPYPAAALPVVTFNDRVTLHLNGESATVYHVAHAHTDGDAIVHFPDSNVIHMGDLFFKGSYPFIDLDGGGGVQGVLAGVELALSLAAEDTAIIPGHGSLSDVGELREYRDFLAAARDRVQALIDDGASLADAIAARPTAQWDEALGQGWIKPDQFVTFVYNSLQGIDHYTDPGVTD